MPVNAPHAERDAFKGQWMSKGGAPFVVFYIDRGESRRRMMDSRGRVHQPGHPYYVLTGWRWHMVDTPDDLHGPFSSSRIAYKDAMEVLK